MASRFGVCRFVVAAIALFALFGSARSQAPAPHPASDGARPLVLAAAIEGAIGPGAVRHVERVIETAGEREAEALILRLNTPGGLVASMREIISAILSSPVPVIGYVAPPGAHAASAGTYILYATHVAAMAPGTNIGAATPVQIGGPGLPGLPSGEEEKKDSGGNEGGKEESGGEGTKAPARSGTAMEAKALNDAVAFIRSLAELHGRNADWAEKAVREAATLSASGALAQKVIDFIADDIEAVAEKADGRRITAGSATRALQTRGATIEVVEVDFLTQALNVLSNPNVAFMLMMVGIYGLIFEFTNPGSIGPGVIGVICLVLALYALNQLPLDYAGLMLVLLGVAFMVAEAITPTFGVLGAGGLIAFTIGAAMLIDTETPAYQLSWWTIGGAAALSGGVLVLVLGYVWRVYRRPPRDMVAEGEARVLDWSGSQGHVWAHGERWHARGARGLKKGQMVPVRGMEGLTLIIGGESAAGAAGEQKTEGV